MFSRQYNEGQQEVRPTIDCGPGLTKQSLKDETNINLIMAKYRRTGTLSFIEARQAEYMDVPEIDFQTAMDIVTRAQAMFDEMPSHLRKEFRNDPAEFLDVMHDPEQRERVYELGLLTRPKEQAEPQAEPAPEPVVAQEP